jgi:hypothetical protein
MKWDFLLQTTPSSVLSNIMFLHHPSWSLQLWLHLDQICISAEPLWCTRMTSKGSHKVVLYSASGSSTHQVLLQNHQCSTDRTETWHSTPCYPMHNSHNLMSQTTKIHNQEPCPIYSKRALTLFISVTTHWWWPWSLKLKLTCCMQAYNTNSVHQNARVLLKSNKTLKVFTRLAFSSFSALTVFHRFFNFRPPQNSVLTR